LVAEVVAEAAAAVEAAELEFLQALLS